jgi:light-regulated signal transduction histidine kinase (bacteriophytochrome)
MAVHHEQRTRGGGTDLATANAALSARNAELEASNLALDGFARVAAHDLSEPLRMVVAFLQLLEREYGAQLDEQAQEYIRFATDGATRMRTLIDALLTFARVDGSTPTRRDVAASDVVAAACRALAPAIHASGAQVSVDALPRISADEWTMTLLFQNLVANALKFSDASPRVAVTGAAEPGGWRFRVDDDGIGIPPESRAEVFEAFRRLHPRSRYDGTGLGLALCRRIVEAHGGTIAACASPMGGTRIEFTIADERSATEEQA